MKTKSLGLALGFTAILSFSSVIPAAAFPPMPSQTAENGSQIEFVRSKGKIYRHRGGRRHSARRHGNRHQNVARHANRHNGRYNNRNYHNRRGHYYYNGHHYYGGYRGYGYYRPGYRRWGGYWYPAAAFVVTAGPVVVRGGNAHVRWCRDHYASYRRSDNTWQPYNGGRRICYSPY
jgi:hypothetical protein